MFTREDYIQQYHDIYQLLGEDGSGGGDDERTEEYYSILQQGGYKEGMSVLDYGCGYGAMLNRYDIKDYYGVDIMPEAIELARKHFPDKKFDVLEIGKLKCEPKDMCIALSVFTHCLVQDVDDCLNDIYRNTKKHLIIDILEGEDSQSNLNVRYWNKEEFIKKLEEHGFKVTGEFKIMAALNFMHTYFIAEKV